MHAHPLLNSTLRHSSATIAISEGTLDAMEGDARLLIAPPHIHLEDDELFYVLEGRIGFRLNDDEVIADSGDAVLVTPGTIHTWWNASAEPARYLLITTNRIDDLIGALHTEQRSWSEMKELFRQHASVLLDEQD